MDLPTVRSFMDNEFVRLTPDLDVYKAIELFLRRGITGAAVVDEQNRLVGVLSEKDCLQILVHGAYNGLPAGRVSQYMTVDVKTVPPEQDVFSVAEMFLREPFRRLLVVTDGKLVGQITRRDLLRAIQKIMKEQKGAGTSY